MLATLAIPEIPPSPYTESLIFQHADAFTTLLVQLSAAEHSATAIEDLSKELERLRARAESYSLLLDSLRREAAHRKRKVDELATGTARTAMLIASKGKQALNAKLAERERRVKEAVSVLAAEERAYSVLQSDVNSLSIKLAVQQKLHQKQEACGNTIDRLYEQIFSGPTPEYPEEDEAENTVFALEKQCKELHLKVENTRSASDMLAEAVTHAAYAGRALETAVS